MKSRVELEYAKCCATCLSSVIYRDGVVKCKLLEEKPEVPPFTVCEEYEMASDEVLEETFLALYALLAERKST